MNQVRLGQREMVWLVRSIGAAWPLAVRCTAVG
jgi:hypothetical protein